MNDSLDTGTVRVGIVGLGTIGYHHADRVHDLATLVGGVDVDQRERERFESTYGVPTYTSLDELLSAGADAIIVTTPNRFHEEYAVGALEANVSVLVEKPLAHSLESAERIASAARASDAVCMVGSNNRFAAGAQVVAEYRDDGRFGEVSHVEANFIRRRGIPGRGTWFTKSAVAGGGALLDIGFHAVDLALYFLGFPDPEEVLGVTRSEFGLREQYTYIEMYGEDAGPGSFDVDDSASAFVRCADGKTLVLEVAWATNRPPDDTFVIHGTDAGAVFNRDSDELTVYEVLPGGTPHLRDVEVRTAEVDRHRELDAAFLRAVASGEEPHINTVEEALTVHRVIDAIYRSSAAASSVRLDDQAASEAPSAPSSAPGVPDVVADPEEDVADGGSDVDVEEAEKEQQAG